ncbi:hypothetical protein Tco_0554754 [Tanacetum coccineum]
MYYEFREAFHRLFDANEGLFRSVLSRNMQNLEMQFSNETLHEKDSNSELRAIKGQFEHFIHSKMFELSKYNTNAREILQDFNAYTTMEAQTFKETIIQNMDSIEQCIIERASHEQELKMTLKKLSERQLQIQQCKVQEVQSSVTSSGDETSSGIVSDEEIDKQKLEAHSSYMAKIQEVSPDESSSTDTPLEQTTTVHEKTTSPRSLVLSIRWQQRCSILKTVCLRWVPTGKTFASSTTKVESEPPNGSNADIPNQCESEQALNVSAGTLLSTADQASVFMAMTFEQRSSSLGHQRQMTSVHISSGLILHQMTSDHNRSELGIYDHSNEPSSSKLVPKVVPLAVKTATSRQELELLFHHHIAMLRTTGGNKLQHPSTKPKMALIESRAKILIKISLEHIPFKHLVEHHPVSQAVIRVYAISL